MKPISQYPVTFPYGATTYPYTPSNPHTGDDRAAPENTPIDVGNIVIGLVGNTGKSTGNHLHIQKWKNGYLNPNGHGVGNKIAFPAKVTDVGYRDDIGYFVRLVDNNDIRWSYFHMIKDSQKVKVGQIINKGGIKMTPSALAALYQLGAIKQIDGDDKFVKDYIGKDPESVIVDLLNSAAHKEVIRRYYASSDTSLTVLKKGIYKVE